MYKDELAFLNETPPSEDSKPEAYWLDDYYADQWVLKTGKNSFELNWDFPLPDGSNMLDNENAILLETCRRTLFDIKNPYYSSIDVSCSRIKFYYHSLVCLAEWMILNKELYHPKEYAFSRLDSDAIRSLIKLFVTEGKDGLQGIVQRTQSALENILIDQDAMDLVSRSMHLIPKNLTRSDWVNESLLTFSMDDSVKLRAWLYLKGFYSKVHTESFKSSDDDQVAYTLKATLIDELIVTRNESVGKLTKLYLRQFEMAEDFEKVALASRYETLEYLPSDYLSIEEKALIRSTKGSSRHLTDLLNVFCYLSPHNKGLPDDKVLSSLDFSGITIHFGAGGDKHTRTTPPKIALQLLDSSIEYVIKYGDGIVDAFLIWAKTSKEIEEDNKGLQWKPMVKLKSEAFKKLPIPSALDSLNIKQAHSMWGNDMGFYRNEFGGHPGGKLCREKMSLQDSITFLFGAVYCLLATMSARRRMELAELKVGCIKGGNGSYELECYLRKSVFEGKRTLIQRPVPNIAARAVLMLERVHEGFKGIHGLSNQSYLFSVPYNSTVYSKTTPSPKSIDRFVHGFCDYIDLEKTAPNRRWYPKSHEFRRFFAIVFFWQFKFVNLSAISWMLGHVDIKHTYAYIRETIGGKEMTKVEASYSAKAMLNSEVDDDNQDALSTLRQLALIHFNCSDISVIEEDDLEMYLEDLLEDGVYQVRPHSFTTEQNIKHTMVFEIKELRVT